MTIEQIIAKIDTTLAERRQAERDSRQSRTDRSA